MKPSTLLAGAWKATPRRQPEFERSLSGTVGAFLVWAISLGAGGEAQDRQPCGPVATPISRCGTGDLYVIIADDIGYQDLAERQALGYTPHIDALAAHGITFTRCYSNSVCSPSRRSMFFGQYWVRESGSYSLYTPDGSEPPLSATSVAELVPGDAHLFGKWHLGADPGGGPWELAPQAHGFELWRTGHASNVGQYSNWLRVDDGVSAVSGVYEPRAVRDAVLASPKSGRLIVVAPQLAHGPFHAPPATFLPPGYPTPYSVDERYRAMVVAFDSFVGQVLANVNLDVDGVIVVGDNGTPQQIAERAKTTTYERGIHVPCIVAGPGLSGGACARLSHVADVYPTVALWFGQPTPTGIDGMQLFGPPHPSVICGTENPNLGHHDRCARDSRFKFRRTGPLGSPPLTEELFDLQLDPGETVSVLGQWPAQEAALRATLDGFEAR